MTVTYLLTAGVAVLSVVLGAGVWLRDGARVAALPGLTARQVRALDRGREPQDSGEGS